MRSIFRGLLIGTAVIAMYGCMPVALLQAKVSCDKFHDLGKLEKKGLEYGFKLMPLHGLQIDRALALYNRPDVPSDNAEGTVRLNRADIDGAMVAYGHGHIEIMFYNRSKCTVGDALTFHNPQTLRDIIGTST